MSLRDLPGARERRVATGGIELCVIELGDAARPTIVLVHGYPDSKEVWTQVARQLAEQWHVVLYDVRGHGRSTAPVPLRGGFTLEKLTDDFLAVADAVSPDRPVHVVGHDWGSVQAWEFATVSRTEGRIASFTSMSGPSLDHFGHWIKQRMARPTPRRVGQLLGQGAKSWYVYMLHTPVLPELAWRGPLGKRWPRILERLEKVPPGDYPTPSLPDDAAHGAWLYRDNVRSRLRRPRADAFAHVPVQLITPTGDIFLSEQLYDGLDAWVPQLTRRSSPAKHWVPRTRPDQLASWIGEFAAVNEAALRDGVPVRDTAPQGAYADRFGGQLVLVTGAAAWDRSGHGLRVRRGRGTRGGRGPGRGGGEPDRGTGPADRRPGRLGRNRRRQRRTGHGEARREGRRRVRHRRRAGQQRRYRDLRFVPGDEHRRVATRPRREPLGRHPWLAGSSASRWPTAGRAAISSTRLRPRRISRPVRCPRTARRRPQC